MIITFTIKKIAFIIAHKVSNPIKGLISFIFIFCCAHTAFSQRVPVSSTNTYVKSDTLQVRLIAKVKEKSIILRWAPLSVNAWEYANTTGYRLDRYTLVKDGKLLAKPIFVSLSQNGILRPQSEAAFGKVYEQTRDAIIALGAQALWGKTFEVKAQDPSIRELADKAIETENRFGFALFAADQSGDVADLMGLRFTDNSPNCSKFATLFQV